MLHQEDGCPLSKPYERRRELLLELLDRVRPDAVTIEMFTFGRRRFHFELNALLDRCYELHSPRPAVLASVRDVLVKPSPGHHEKAAAVITTYFDRVLVHGQAELPPFGTTFTHADRIESKLCYTGYVVHTPSAAATPTTAPPFAGTAVLVCAGGGGSTGNADTLYRSAMEARSVLLVQAAAGGDEAAAAAALIQADWRVLVGWMVPEAQFKLWQTELPALCGSAGGHRQGVGAVTVERNLQPASYLAAVKVAAAVVCRGGYNTVAELLATGCSGKAVVVPFVAGSDDEQLVRAKALAARHMLKFVSAEDADGPALAAALTAAAGADRTRSGGGCAVGEPTPRIELDGAGRAAAEIVGMARLQRAIPPPARLPQLPIAAACRAGPPDGRGAAAEAPRVTVLLLHYKRRENLLRILGCLDGQQPRPAIFLWNNSEEQFTDSRVDWQIDSAANRFCWPRWFMGSLARSEFVCTLDDDLLLTDPNVRTPPAKHTFSH